ncbi:MAG: nuclear transport factor 2 family protein [Proteobacteria bacterium]|nr:nuclear transport factor 2 family protein [Pseudomonadota bacterium]MDA1153673.1 nuclear transport factor 2 family protein [Pseudomonadota bacterium]
MTHPDQFKALLAPMRAALATAHADQVQSALRAVFAPDAIIRLCHPFGDLIGPDALYQQGYGALLAAMPDLERRDMILLAGTTPQGQDWVGCMGNYMGSFIAPLLDIRPTGHLAHMRYHEYFRLEAGKIVEMQAIWDIPEVMMQAGVWPMGPQLGALITTPAPMSGDGLTASGDGQATMDHVLAMLTALCRHPADPDPAVMEMPRYWHPRFNWYGPAGIGAMRGIAGFRHWHQIPFLGAMPDRGLDSGGLMSHWFAQGDYVCETGWPNMRLTITRDGWLGIAPAGQPITLRSLDFWRMEDGLIRENWVLVDLLDMWAQIGVDVLGRMREFNKARNMGHVSLPDGLS